MPVSPPYASHAALQRARIRAPGALEVIRLLPLLLLATILLTACESISGVDEEGVYTATITGAVDATYTGRAGLERGVGLDEFEYAVVMQVPGLAASQGILLFFAERPRQGTYTVVNMDAAFLERDQVSAFVNTGASSILGTSGEVRIISTRPLQGTFDFVGVITSREQARVGGEFRF